MTKIYIYCLFDTMDRFLGVYSSLKAVHRDALRLANRSCDDVVLLYEGRPIQPTLTNVRNAFKGRHDVEIKYRTMRRAIRVYKTRLKE